MENTWKNPAPLGNGIGSQEVAILGMIATPIFQGSDVTVNGNLLKLRDSVRKL